MADLIDRQAVIDLIEHYNSDGLGAVFYGYEEGVKFADAVNKLPSVQPKSENAKFLEFLMNTINPNEMEHYLTMYRCRSE